MTGWSECVRIRVGWCGSVVASRLRVAVVAGMMSVVGSSRSALN